MGVESTARALERNTAADVALLQGLSPFETTRLFALLNFALADAGISSWDAKYHYNMWRPIDAIREAAQDGNGATLPDSNWEPLLTTPSFPTYTSGHSTFKAAQRRVCSPPCSVTTMRLPREPIAVVVVNGLLRMILRYSSNDHSLVFGMQPKRRGS